MLTSYMCMISLYLTCTSMECISIKCPNTLKTNIVSAIKDISPIYLDTKANTRH